MAAMIEARRRDVESGSYLFGNRERAIEAATPAACGIAR
jgi:hypothetical protein